MAMATKQRLHEGTAGRTRREIGPDLRRHHKLVAGTWSDNPASMHILEKAGFERTGWGSVYCDGRNAEAEGPDYELTRETWEARQ